jgi:hypothetical protein
MSSAAEESKPKKRPSTASLFHMEQKLAHVSITKRTGPQNSLTMTKRDKKKGRPILEALRSGALSLGGRHHSTRTTTLGVRLLESISAFVTTMSKVDKAQNAILRNDDAMPVSAKKTDKTRMWQLVASACSHVHDVFYRLALSSLLRHKQEGTEKKCLFYQSKTVPPHTLLV